MRIYIINCTDIERSNGLDKKTENNEGHSFVTIAAKWLASLTDDES